MRSMTFDRRSLLLAALALPAAPALAQEGIRAGDLAIGAPWTRATPAGSRVAGGYMTIRNTGSEPDALVGGSLAVAGRVEIHEMAMADGVMRMRELPQGLVIPPGGSVDLRPGGYHVMFLDLAQPLRQGDRVTGTLRFRRAGEVRIDYTVQAMGDGPDGRPQGHGR
jgi:copper(I)-binding protein